MRSSLVALALLLAAPVVHAAQEPERVIMKLDEFLKLYEKNRAEEQQAPLDFAISSARYTGDVQLRDGEPYAAVFTARLRVDVLRSKGYVKVPVLPATVALESAKIGAAEADIIIENGYYTLVTAQRGAINLDLNFAVAVTSAEGASGLDFSAGAGRRDHGGAVGPGP